MVVVGQKVLIRRGRKEAGSKIESANWFCRFLVKEENHLRYKFHTDDRRIFGYLVYFRRLGSYSEREYGPNAC